MQPAATANDGTGVKLVKGEVVGGAGAPVNEEKFWKRRVEDIPVDQVWLRFDAWLGYKLTDSECRYSSTNSSHRRARRRKQRLLRLTNGKFMMKSLLIPRKQMTTIKGAVLLVKKVVMAKTARQRKLKFGRYDSFYMDGSVLTLCFVLGDASNNAETSW